MTIPKKHRALSSGALAPGARFPTRAELELRTWWKRIEIRRHMAIISLSGTPKRVRP